MEPRAFVLLYLFLLLGTITGCAIDEEVTRHREARCRPEQVGDAIVERCAIPGTIDGVTVAVTGFELTVGTELHGQADWADDSGSNDWVKVTSDGEQVGYESANEKVVLRLARPDEAADWQNTFLVEDEPSGATGDRREAWCEGLWSFLQQVEVQGTPVPEAPCGPGDASDPATGCFYCDALAGALDGTELDPIVADHQRLGRAQVMNFRMRQLAAQSGSPNQAAVAAIFVAILGALDLSIGSDGWNVSWSGDRFSAAEGSQ